MPEHNIWRGVIPSPALSDSQNIATMAQSRHQLLKEHLSAPSKPLRPILTSLNGDNSWLMSFPRPAEEKTSTGKAYYHVVFEPWLKGPTSMYSSWMVHITLSSPPELSDADAIEAVAREIEDAAVTHKPPPLQDGSVQGGRNGMVDAILLGFHFLDHLHEPTLRSFSGDIPIIAVPKAADIVRGLNHFKTIRTIQDLDSSAKSWRTPELHPGDPLPTWLTPIRLSGHHILNFCLATTWTHTVNGEEIHEVIFSSPHGTRLDEGPLNAFLNAEPKTEKLAMLHGLKESHSAGSQTTLGAKGGLALFRKVGGVKHWIPTHSSKLWYNGIIMRLTWTNDTWRTLEWALEEEHKESPDSRDARDLERPNLHEVANGESTVLT
ncbi:hypothetical protein FDECE_6066 [Fusarium decemcellulare]|nr:hypothetical protein FDECE_6066 [Fusarium decemcellulare]